MALNLAALLPHSPLLIPEIGRANYDFLNKTAVSYDQIGEGLKEKLINTLIIISPHGLAENDSFVLNVSPEMEVDLKDFGFIPPKTVIGGDALLADQIKTAIRPEVELQLISENLLDYGSAIPLYLLKDFIPNLKIIILNPAKALSLEEHYQFGEKLQSVITGSEKNIAVIASGDLSHRLKKKSPAGYSPKGAKFDNKLIEYLSEPQTAVENILKMDPKLIASASECGLKPLVILLGLMNGMSWQTQIMAYQTDFGIGYLSAEFKLPS